MDLSSRAAAMTFLNEISSEYPSAISLAAGRPTDRFFGRLSSRYLAEAMVRYEHWAARDISTLRMNTPLLQYGRTAGIIADLIAMQLCLDEGVAASAERILITSGCQEGLALCLPALCPHPGDVVLMRNPTYAGATGAARASGVEVCAIPNTTNLVSGIEIAIEQLQRSGKRARALYLIPTFDNPTGELLEESERRAILSVCARSSIVILEDNAYGMFRYEGQAVPPMAALDEAGCVIYLSTFSKTLAPALRIGAVTVPETLFGDRAARCALWKELVQRKSFLTVNTGQIGQAIVGGLLLDQNGSLQRWIEPAVGLYRNSRDTMLDELKEAFPAISNEIWWNRPSGGFFLAVELPFRFDADDVLECAVKHGVLVMPMSFFALDDSQDYRIRLSFSGVDPQQIQTGIRSLADYVAERLSASRVAAEIVH